MYMAKTIMVSDEIYAKLDKAKRAKNYSFSELFSELLEMPDRKNWANSIKSLAGTWEKTKEDEKITAELKKGWANWNKKYALTQTQ